VTLPTGKARHRFGQTIIANFIGCALLVVGYFTTPVIFALGFVILVISLGVRLYVLTMSRRGRPQ
jgi:uncharacterized membrane protein YphA (DoxX/SURF4 family)